MRLSSDRPSWGAAGLFIGICVWLLPSPSLSAQSVAGTIHNGTTGKPAARDAVVLIRLGQGMEEVAGTRTDAKGHFSFRLPDAGPYLIRAIHQGVTYHRMAPPGTNSIELQVFDVSRNVGGISVKADVMRLQAQGNVLRGIRLFVVKNASNPPRTQMHGDDFQFFLPDGAQIDQGMAMTAEGQPINSSPVAERANNCYGFKFPLRPGDTQFQVAFHARYGGELSFDPKALYGAQHFVVMVPKTMRFTPAPGIAYQAMEDPRQPDALVRVVSNTRTGQALNFSISGTGTLNDPGDDSLGPPHPVEGETVAPPASGIGRSPGPNSSVAGTPDFLGRYRWYALGAFLLLGAGAIFFMRLRGTPVSHSKASEPAFTAAKPSSHSDLRFDNLKNELFQLEVDRQQGRISQPEYQRARAVLDRTLNRAIKRAARK